MKNKQKEQELKKEEHKAKLREAKAKRRQDPNINRRPEKIERKSRILIACEGKNTEKDYFDRFKAPAINIEVLGIGDNTVSLVDKTIKIRDSKPKNYYDEVWCVFDADPKPDNPAQLQNFNKAIWKAEQEKILVAYSHQAFEYWLLLHFNDYQGEPMNRDLYKQNLNTFLKPFELEYDNDKRSKSISEELFDVLMAKEKGKRRVDWAIARSEKIFKELDHSNPSKNESSTSVFLLVQKLLEMK